MCTGSSQPTLNDLSCHVVMKAAQKWRDLGVQLLEDNQFQIGMLDIIGAEYNDVRCCEHVLEMWLQITPNASWNQLISALRSPTVQLDRLADQLEKMLSIKCKIYSNSYSLLQTVHYEYREYCGQSNHDK